MFNFEEITNRLLALTNIKNKSQLAKEMDVSTATMGNWKRRNKIPYEEIITICLKYKIDINYIFSGAETELNILNNSVNKNITITGDNNKVSNIKTFGKKLEIIEKLEKLPKKRQEYYYHMISADILNMEE